MTREAAWFSCTVWCGKKQVLDCTALTLAEARGRVRASLEKHADKVTAWFIHDESQDVPVQVAGCQEVEE